MRNDPLPFRPPVTCDDLVNFYAREQRLARRRPPRFLAHFLFWIAFLVALFFAVRFILGS